MNIRWKIVFWIILVVSAYHLVRDLLQIVDWESWFTNVAHRSHQWCGRYCDYVTLPFDLIGALGAGFVLWRQRIGVLGWIILGSMPLWLLAVFLP